jgi:hypothetical protein
MPIAVQVAVSIQDKPRVAPVNGPPTNLMVLAMITERYKAVCIKRKVS